MRQLVPLFFGFVFLAACSSAGGSAEPDVLPTGPGTSREGGSSSGEPIDPDGGDAGLPPNGAPVYQSGTRLKARWAVTQDGYRSFDGWFDATRKEACTQQTAADGKKRCLPTDAVSASTIFSDASCTARLAYVVGETCQPPASVFLYDPATQSRRIFQRGAKHTGTGYFTSEGKCLPIPNVTSYYAIGPEVPASSFVEMVAAVTGSSARVIERFLVGDDGSHEFVGWTDQTLETSCFFRPTRDSSVRCVPFVTVAGTYFSDTSCKVPVVTHDLTRTDVPLFASIPSGSCTQGNGYYRVGASVPGDKLSMLGGGACTPSPSARKAWTMSEIMPPELVAPVAMQDPAGRIRGSILATPEEGKRQFLEWTDTALANAPCSFETTFDGKVRCVPNSVTATGVDGNQFSDAACTKPISYGRTTKGDCTRPRYAKTYVTGCTVAPRHFRLKLTPYTGDIYTKFGSAGACNKSNTSSNSDVYEIDGAEVPLSAFAEGSFATDL